jgi:hypothetical protein
MQELIDSFESNQFKDVFIFENSYDHSARYSLFVLIEFIYLYSNAGLGSQQLKVLSDDGKSLAFECKVLDKEKILEFMKFCSVPFDSISILFPHIELLTGLKD